MSGSSSYPPANTNSAGQVISTDRFMVEDIDELLAEVITLIMEIYDEIYEDVKTIDDMQSKFLDVVCSEVTEVRDALDDIVEMAEVNKKNNTEIYQKISSLDISYKGL